jgi:hypothetical protein
MEVITVGHGVESLDFQQELPGLVTAERRDNELALPGTSFYDFSPRARPWCGPHLHPYDASHVEASAAVSEERARDPHCRNLPINWLQPS